MITPEEWRTFCSDAVLMARFPKYNYLSGEPFNAHVELCWYRNETPSTLTLHWELSTEDGTHSEGTVETGVPADANYIDICDLKIDLPAAERMTKAALSLQIEGTNIRKGYDLWIYPETSGNYLDGIRIFEKLTDEVIGLLEQGENVLLMPKPEALNNVVEGYYCTDFWCYPMFRSISESMNREVPIGTMGLLIDNTHPVFRDFPCEPYSTYPWWRIQSGIILTLNIKKDNKGHTSITNIEYIPTCVDRRMMRGSGITEILPIRDALNTSGTNLTTEQRTLMNRMLKHTKGILERG